MDKHGRKAFIASGLGWGLDGYTFTMFSMALPSIIIALNMSVADGGWIVTFSLLASAIGGIIGGMLADRYGRARVLAYIILAFSVATALTSTSQDVYQLTFWRIVEGLAFGAEWPVGAALLAEYASAEKRGRVMGFLQGTYALGWALSTLVFWIVFANFSAEVAWRYLFLTGIIPALAIFYLRRNVKDRVVIQKNSKAKPPFIAIFQGKQLRITVLTTFLGIGAQGIYYSVFTFLPLYLKEVRNLPLIGTALYLWIVIAGSFIGYVTAGYLHDKLGRRKTFSVFYTGSIITLGLFIFLPIEGAFIPYLVAFFLGYFASGQAAGLGSFLSEQFPTAIRATGQGFSYNVGRGIAAFSPAFIGVMSAKLGLGNAIIIVGLVAFSIAIFVVWLLPETNGKVIIDEYDDNKKFIDSNEIKNTI
jgi:MFS family permease